MNYELSHRYNEKRKEIYDDSWAVAGVLLGIAFGVFLVGTLLYAGLVAGGKERVMSLIVITVAAMYFVFRYAFIAWKMYQLKKKFAIEAMTS